MVGHNKRMKESYQRDKIPSVYIIEASQGIYKIGHASNPKKRVSQLQGGCPHTYKNVTYLPVRDPKGIERFLHSRLSPRHLRGEWYALSPAELSEIIRLIQEMALD
jgi:hypothetical protein